MSEDSGRSLAVLIARLVLGLMFFMAGVFKVFEMGVIVHARELFLPFADTFLPAWSLWAMGTAIPFVELAAGLLLLIGFKTRWALIALAAVLVMLPAELLSVAISFASQAVLGTALYYPLALGAACCLLLLIIATGTVLSLFSIELDARKQASEATGGPGFSPALGLAGR